jgi:hypothetical protein
MIGSKDGFGKGHCCLEAMVAFGMGYWEAVGGMGHAEGY